MTNPVLNSGEEPPIEVLPPNLLDQIREVFYDVTTVQSKRITTHTDYSTNQLTGQSQLRVTVEHTVEVIAERPLPGLRRPDGEPHILIQGGRELG